MGGKGQFGSSLNFTFLVNKYFKEWSWKDDVSRCIHENICGRSLKEQLSLWQVPANKSKVSEKTMLDRHYVLRELTISHINTFF